MQTTALKIRAHSAQVGPNLTVLRALPTAQLNSVGPFVFLDHFGPFATTHGGPSAHPHAGIEVITWLFEGKNEHRDSMGHDGFVHSGGAQWMKSGRGAIHAETMHTDAPITHGLQLWTRQPIARQEEAPEYARFEAVDIPDWTQGAARLRLLIGTQQNQTGPVKLGLDALAMNVTLPAGSQIEIALNPSHEIGVYGILGQIELLETPLERGELLRLADNSASIKVTNNSDAEAVFVVLGGESAPKPLIFDGPFVFESRERMNQAKRDFVTGKMGQLDGVPF